MCRTRRSPDSLTRPEERVARRTVRPVGGRCGPRPVSTARDWPDEPHTDRDRCVTPRSVPPPSTGADVDCVEPARAHCHHRSDGGSHAPRCLVRTDSLVRASRSRPHRDLTSHRPKAVFGAATRHSSEPVCRAADGLLPPDSTPWAPKRHRCAPPKQLAGLVVRRRPPKAPTRCKRPPTRGRWLLLLSVALPPQAMTSRAVSPV